ncbi:MAG TPA: DUF192 domain-containing protein [Gemmatimonadales bacterium]|nr:DUF192 domain-containing protein [Gemmatimonadales bacterium]
MRLLRVVNTARGRELGTRIRLADAWLSRLRGMLGRPAPAAGEGLLLTPCRSAHMYGMRFPLDIAFLDARRAVVAVYHSLPPGSRTRWHGVAVHALELPAGTLIRSGTVVGDVLAWADEPADRDREIHRTMEAVS